MVQISSAFVHRPSATLIADLSSPGSGQRRPQTGAPAGRARTRLVLAVAVAVAVATIAALGACGKPVQPPTTLTAAPALSAPPSTKSTVDARAAARQSAVDAYRGMWAAYATAGLTANPDEPSLAVYASGQALSMLRDGLTATRRKGRVFKGEYRTSPTVVDTGDAGTPTSVVIADCLDTSHFLTYKATGGLAGDTPGGRRSASATVRLRDGRWTVVSFGVREKGTC
jgi:hypothetical protein